MQNVPYLLLGLVIVFTMAFHVTGNMSYELSNGLGMALFASGLASFSAASARSLFNSSAWAMTPAFIAFTVLSILFLIGQIHSGFLYIASSTVVLFATGGSKKIWLRFILAGTILPVFVLFLALFTGPSYRTERLVAGFQVDPAAAFIPLPLMAFGMPGAILITTALMLLAFLLYQIIKKYINGHDTYALQIRGVFAGLASWLMLVLLSQWATAAGLTGLGRYVAFSFNEIHPLGFIVFALVIGNAIFDFSRIENVA